MGHYIDKKIDHFLLQIRAKALSFAVFRLKSEDVALDILQETMMGFVKTANQYDEEAWNNLFYKILTRRITDWQRKQSWRKKLHHVLPFADLPEVENGQDNLYTDANNNESNPVQSQQNVDQLASHFERALGLLPARQQEAYLLRQWQGLSILETASIMGCSQGSVKTHFFRALQTLKLELGEWIDE